IRDVDDILPAGRVGIEIVDGIPAEAGCEHEGVVAVTSVQHVAAAVMVTIAFGRHRDAGPVTDRELSLARLLIPWMAWVGFDPGLVRAMSVMPVRAERNSAGPVVGTDG